MDNVVIYARYSSDKQTEQSIEGQLRYCYQYAEQHDYRVVGEYIDRAISGTSDRRPQFQQMISDAKNTGTLGDTEMHFLRQGTYEEQREALKKRGANLNQIKPLRVIKEDKKDFFFSHIAE